MREEGRGGEGGGGCHIPLANQSHWLGGEALIAGHICRCRQCRYLEAEFLEVGCKLSGPLGKFVDIILRRNTK